MRRNVKPGIAVCSLVAAHLVVLFAGFVAPYSPAEQFRADSFTAPGRIHFVDTAGKFHFRPSVQVESSQPAVPVEFFVRGSRYNLLGAIPASVHLFGVHAPAHVFLFGTDAYGRDQFSRFLYGGQVSIAVGLLAAALTLSIGTVAGLLAGFYGWADNLVMRGSEFFLSLPWIYLLLGIRAVLPLSMPPERVFLLLIAVIGVLGWGRPARLVRGLAKSSKTLPFVVAARQFGASDFYLMRRHVLPETYSVLLAQAALLVPQYVAAEVTLSFFGLGIAEPLSSWGTMLGNLRDIDSLATYWWIGLPALALIPFFLCYRLFAQSLQQPAVSRA